MQAKAHLWLLLLLLLVVAGTTQAALPPNTPITNTASAVFTIGGTPVTVSGSSTVTTSTTTPASIGFLSYVPASASGGAGPASLQPVPPAGCSAANGTWSGLPAPNVPGTGLLSLPGAYPLAPATAYAGRDVAFVQVTDYSRNLDPLQADTLTVTVAAAGGDSETLRLTETGPSTGVFMGYVPIVHGAPQPGNCSLQAAGNERLTASYLQTASGAVVTSAALVDPLGLVFDSGSGQPVDGARVTLIDVATGKPALVRGEDGVSTFPSTVVSGSTVTDSAGTTYVLAPGRYQFPRVAAPGTYQLKVEPPQGYRAPSQVTDAVLQALPGAPFVLSAISRGAAFTALPGPPVQADIPLDPGPLGEVDISKSAGKTVATPGDFVPYVLTITTTSAAPLGGVVVADRLPAGFRYAAGSARLNDARTAEPSISADGRTLQFAVGTVSAAAASTLRYAAVVGPSARPGPAENTARAVGRIASNTARASVLVQEELNRSRAILVGRVSVSPSCDADPRDPAATHGLRGVRVLLQDGTYVLTDDEGNWHVDNVRPGTHVVQLDTTTLPAGMQLRSCDANSRTGGRDFSQFVNVRGGTLWRADFRLVAQQSCVDQDVRRQGRQVEVLLGAPVANQGLSATLTWDAGARVAADAILLDGKPVADAQVEKEFAVVRLPAQPGAWTHRLTYVFDGESAPGLTLSTRVQPTGAQPVGLPPLSLPPTRDAVKQCALLPAPLLAPRERATGQPQDAGAHAATAAAPGPVLVEQLPYDDKWLAGAAPGIEWLHPKAGFNPALPVVKVAVKHARDQEVELRVNGAPVDPLSYEGAQLSPSGSVALSNWRAVRLQNGSNVLELVVYGAGRQVLHREVRQIHYGVNPAKAVLAPQQSRLVADGRTTPIVAVRLLDVDGKPVRRGATGEFTLNAPYLSQQQADAVRRDPLTGDIGGPARYEIGDDGVALIALQPTSQSGEAVLQFDFGNNRTSEVRAWLQPDAREWVLVGFGEGTSGHRRLSGNMEALADAAAGEQLFDRDRLAFFAKGQIRGDYLLTAAYDSAKERGTGVNPALRQAIDPNRFYTLYGDATQARHDAASIGKLYLKIEKQQFYALFGDYDTGLTVTELGRYSRTLNGLKSEYRGETFSYNTFASHTAQAFLKDEIQGDGTSGLYRLRTRNILENSERARIEVRDRFQPDRVLSTRSLTQWVDYQVDYAVGTLQLRAPLASRDTDLNPLFLVVEYESDDGANAAWTYGGRGAMRVNANTEVGLTRIHEGTVGRPATLSAADATVKIDESTRLKLELATSTRSTGTTGQSGAAYVAELVHDDGKLAARAYAREQQPGFGLGQQTLAAQGQRKVGGDVRLRLSETLQVQAEAFLQEDLTTGASRQVTETKVQWSASDTLRFSTGARAVTEQEPQKGDANARQVTAGVTYEAVEHKLQLRASTDIDAGTSGPATVNYPNVLALGADYRITPQATVSATQEFARGDSVRADTTRVGLRTQLWQGADLQSGIGDQSTLDGGRLFASLGLVQKLRIDEHWSADAGLDQTRTLRSTANPLGAAQPPASGTPAPNGLPSGTAGPNGYGLVTGNATAVSLGLAYRDDAWSANLRTEWRGSDTDTKVNVLAGVQRRLGQGVAVAAGVTLNEVRGGSNDTNKAAARLSYAWRPTSSEWIWMDRLEYVQESSPSLATQLFTRKLINSLNANWRPDTRTQLALQYAAKFVRESLQDLSASGFTDLVGLELRHDVTERWDVGLHAGMLRSRTLRSHTSQLGLSVGYRVATNTWVSVGYNGLGFRDPDFAGSEYRAKGIYLNMRVKFDQDTFDLNDKVKGQLPVKP